MDKDSKKIIEMIESGQADAYMIVASPIIYALTGEVNQNDSAK